MRFSQQADSSNAAGEWKLMPAGLVERMQIQLAHQRPEQTLKPALIG
jgi:hypothetical protein